MEKLSEYDNLINAMGALFYTSKKMVSQVPCIFQSWKDMTFEKGANRIHDLLSQDDQKSSKSNDNLDKL